MEHTNIALVLSLLVFFILMGIIIAYYAIEGPPKPEVKESLSATEAPLKEYSERKLILQAEPERFAPEPIPEEPEEELMVIDEETYLLAQIITAEAKGESYEGMIAVGNVVMNRVKHSEFPDTIREVIFQKGQFSPVSNGSIYNIPTDKAVEAAVAVIDGESVVGDALYFYNPKIATNRWIFSRKTIKTIGNHRFAL